MFYLGLDLLFEVLKTVKYTERKQNATYTNGKIRFMVLCIDLYMCNNSISLYIAMLLLYITSSDVCLQSVVSVLQQQK